MVIHVMTGNFSVLGSMTEQLISFVFSVPSLCTQVFFSFIVLIKEHFYLKNLK